MQFARYPWHEQEQICKSGQERECRALTFFHAYEKKLSGKTFHTQVNSVKFYQSVVHIPDG